MASSWTLQLHSLSFKPSICVKKRPVLNGVFELEIGYGLSTTGIRYGHFNCYLNRYRIDRKFLVRVAEGSMSSDTDQNIQDDDIPVKNGVRSLAFENYIGKMRDVIISSPTGVFLVNRCNGSGFAIGLFIATVCLAIVARVYVLGKSRNSHSGSVADLVRRGQLRSDRRGMYDAILMLLICLYVCCIIIIVFCSSKPLKYNDPFNNPLVKVDKSNSSVEMCGKVYRLAPVTLTKVEQSVHQKRRSRAYQWKRPTMFLKEGDSIPPDVDPDTIRWIPANHPFATTASDIDEDLAQTNVYQKHGVPFRIKAEHEALQKKLEALQSEQKLNNFFIDPGSIKDFERPFKSKAKSEEQVEQSFSDQQASESKPPNSGHLPSSFKSTPDDEAQKS